MLVKTIIIQEKHKYYIIRVYNDYRMWIQNKLKGYVNLSPVVNIPGTVCHYVVISMEVFDCSACVELYSLLYVCICLSAGGINIKRQVIKSY